MVFLPDGILFVRLCLAVDFVGLFLFGEAGNSGCLMSSSGLTTLGNNGSNPFLFGGEFVVIGIEDVSLPISETIE
jgi:hypothetical protein